MLDSGMEIIFLEVATHGLAKSWLGEPITPERVKQFKTLQKKFGVDMCGEGGENESQVIDALWFNKRREIIDAEKTGDWVSGRYSIREARLQVK